jgi:hypothetical protein
MTSTGHRQLALPGKHGAPLLVLLHGRGSNPEAFLRDGVMQQELRRLGPRAPSVVLPSCSDHCYWHDRGDGAWGRYVLRRVIPAAVRRLHADPRRVAIGGVSMGGFGAIDLARIAPRRFCAVGGHSAALWHTGGETPAGAFDDAADFARHDVFHLPFRYRGPLWLDAGDEDPFLASDRDFARLHCARWHSWPGGHGWSYWGAHLGAYLSFYADACGQG